MGILDTIAGVVLLGGMFSIFTFINYRILFMRIRKAEKIPSPAPLIGGMAGAFLVICFAGFKYPWLIVLPLLIDPGSIPLIICLVICLVMDFTRKG